MRIQVNLSDEMVEKLNDYSKMLGVPRSSLCAVWLGQAVAGIDKAMSTIEKMVPSDGLIDSDVPINSEKVVQE